MVRPVLMTVVGSADAFNSSGRRHSCYLVERPGEPTIMVDFGPTALSGIRRLGREPKDIDGILITHLHCDHIGGLPFLVLDSMFHVRRSEPLRLLGPLQLKGRLQNLLEANYPDLTQHQPPFELDIREVEPNRTVEWLNLTIETFPADHMDPPDQPLCLRVTDAAGRTVAFSGDTSMSPGLEAAARGADLLVAECTGLRHPVGRHCAWEDWAVKLHDMDAERVLLSHLGDDVREAAQRGELTTEADVRLEFADDGLMIEV